jgi:hypothetical protein
VRHPDNWQTSERSWAEAVVPVGWPPLAEVLEKVVSKKIQIYDRGMCSRARGVTDGDLTPWNAKFGRKETIPNVSRK